MKIATAGSVRSKRWRTQETTWDGVLRRLRETMRTGETCAEYRRMTKEEQGTKKEAAGGFVGGALNGGRRVAGAVTERYLITLDADEARPGDWENAVGLNEWAMAVYSTHSHTPEKPRLRWVLPLSRPVSREEYEPLCRRVAYDLGVLETLDPSTYQPERLMYWPTSPQDGEYLFFEQDGPWVNPDELLAGYGPGEAWRDVSGWPLASREKEIVRRELKHQQEPTAKGGIVGAFCRTYDIYAAIDAFLSDVYEEAGEGRFTYTGGSTAGGAVVYGDGAWLYSNHATDPAWGQLCNAFDLVRIHRFGELDEGREVEDSTKLPSYVAMSRWCAELDEVKAQRVTEALERAQEDFADMEQETPEPGENHGGERDVDWKRQLDVDPKSGKIKPSINNAVVLLRNLPDFAGKIGYNPMSGVITVKGTLPWWRTEEVNYLDAFLGPPEQATVALHDGAETEGEKHALLVGTAQHLWGENDWPCLYQYMERYGFETHGLKNGMLDNALSVVAHENKYHPVRSWLMELKWDGVPRVETMLMRWFDVEDTPLDRLVTRLWMMGGVDRIMRPGCQFDATLVLKGPQGKGKSKFFRTLANGYFTNSIAKPEVSKANSEMLQGVWIVEFGELDGIKRGDLNAAKNFLTTTTDRYRGAYRRDATDMPRQCIFAGTSNDCSFLRDATGERRYWVVPTPGRKDNGEMVGFADEVPQLWAEAVVMWRQHLASMCRPGQIWETVDAMLYLRDPAMEAAMEERRQGYKLPEEDRGMVEAYLDEPRPSNWYDMEPVDRMLFANGQWIGDAKDCSLRVEQITLMELRCELFKEKREDAGLKSGRSLRIADIMDTTPGWRRCGRKRVRGYGGAMSHAWERA